LSFLLFLAGKVNGQDIHFSQFWVSPMNLNPALAGNFDGALRFTGNFRNQWRSVTVPYQTFGMSADGNENLFYLKNTGAGISIYNDRAGDSQLNTLQINLAGSYGVNLNNSHRLILGFQSGITQKRINYDRLTFDSQYNGTQFDPGLSSNESFDRAARIFANLNSGVLWKYHIHERKNYSAGISFLNITSPRTSYFNNMEIKLDRRLNIHATAQLKINERWDILPAVLIMGQGTYRELTLGGSLKYYLDNPRSKLQRALYFGGWSRLVDAAILSAGMDYNTWHFGISYDINYSTLTPASNYRGAIEFSVVYILKSTIPHKKRYKFCPKFI
jgi:type IX secretion system PorP/SprF family membrane protein